MIVDELGRGTSSNTGFGLTWAIAEKICGDLDTFCLYSTHFHEITDLSTKHPNAKNYSMCASEKDGKMTMEFSLYEGAIGNSYGLNVLRMVNVAPELIEQSYRNMETLNQIIGTNQQMSMNNIKEVKKLQENHNFKEMVIKSYQNFKNKLDAYKPGQEAQKQEFIKKFRDELEQMHYEFGV